jgi:hypothetical protein
MLFFDEPHFAFSCRRQIFIFHGFLDDLLANATGYPIGHEMLSKHGSGYVRSTAIQADYREQTSFVCY